MRLARVARIRCFLSIAPLLAGCSTSAATRAQDGKLEAVRGAVRDDEDGPSSSAAAYDEEEDDFFTELLGELIELVCYLPVGLPRGALDDDGRADARFRASPGSGGPGYWISSGAADATDAGEAWSFRPRVEFGTDFDELDRVGLALAVEHASRLGFDVAWSRFEEPLANGDTDELELGDANFVYRFAQAPRAAWRGGLGVNWLHDDDSTDLGVNFTYAADFLPSEHATVGFETDFGALGDAGLFHARVSAGYVIGRIELCASWDGWRIGGADLSSFALGLRGWL